MENVMVKAVMVQKPVRGARRTSKITLSRGDPANPPDSADAEWLTIPVFLIWMKYELSDLPVRSLGLSNRFAAA
jgi:hypothetical protein